MQKMIMSMLAGCCVVLSAQAAEDAELAVICDKLEAALERQTDALSSVTDAASAVEALPEIRKALAEQKSLCGVDERELWNYIDHTEGVKTSLLLVLQRMAAQVDRLLKVNFYDNEELRTLIL